MTRTKPFITLAALILTTNFAAADAPVPAPEIQTSDSPQAMRCVDRLVSITLTSYDNEKRQLTSEILQMAKDYPQYRDRIIKKLIAESNAFHNNSGTAVYILTDIANSVDDSVRTIFPALANLVRSYGEVDIPAGSGLVNLAKKPQYFKDIMSTLTSAASSGKTDGPIKPRKAIDALGVIAESLPKTEDNTIKMLFNIARTEKERDLRSAAVYNLVCLRERLPWRQKEIVTMLLELLKQEKDLLIQSALMSDLHKSAADAQHRGPVIIEFISLLEEHIHNENYKNYFELQEYTTKILSKDDVANDLDDPFRKKATDILLRSVNECPDTLKATKLTDLVLRTTIALKHLLRPNNPAYNLVCADWDNINDFRAALRAAGCLRSLVPPEVLILTAKDASPQIRKAAVTGLGLLLRKFKSRAQNKEDVFDLQINLPVKTTQEAKLYELLEDIAANDADPEVKKLAAEITAAQGEIPVNAPVSALFL